MTVVALAVLTMASGGSTLGWQGTESEFGREDRSLSLSSFGDTVKKIWNNLLQNFISFMLSQEVVASEQAISGAFQETDFAISPSENEDAGCGCRRPGHPDDDFRTHKIWIECRRE
ncbi:hypothetical protein MRX96_016706 [Rhipicephalus microplus]